MDTWVLENYISASGEQIVSIPVLDIPIHLTQKAAKKFSKDSAKQEKSADNLLN